MWTRLDLLLGLLCGRQGDGGVVAEGKHPGLRARISENKRTLFILDGPKMILEFEGFSVESYFTGLMDKYYQQNIAPTS